VARGWRRLHDEELHNLYTSPNIRVKKSRQMRWAGNGAHMRNVHKILVRKPESKRKFGRPGRRREDNIRIVLREIGWEVVDWIYLTQDRDQ
jgi:hypothetical protein